MFKIIMLISIVFSTPAFAKSELADYCNEDPTGELYSSAWDAHSHDFLVEIGLPGKKYQDLVDSLDSNKRKLIPMALSKFLV